MRIKTRKKIAIFVFFLFTYNLFISKPCFKKYTYYE